MGHIKDMQKTKRCSTSARMVQVLCSTNDPLQQHRVSPDIEYGQIRAGGGPVAAEMLDGQYGEDMRGRWSTLLHPVRRPRVPSTRGST